MSAPSVVNVTDTAVGFPEISFFKDYYFNTKVSDDMKTQFQDIVLYKDK